MTSRVLAVLFGFSVGSSSLAFGQDCNINGVPDDEDIAIGTSQDGNANGIPDECEGCPVAATFDSSNFADGFSINLDAYAFNLRRSEQPRPLANLWVAASNRGTIVRIDTDTGEIVGEYFTAPHGRGRDPSRTAVNLDGEVWVGNRAESGQHDAGSVARIGLVVGGTPIETWCTLDNRITLAPPFDYNTCIDRNGDGYITTSGGLEPLAWPHDADFGSPATAVDECIVAYVPTAGRGVRHVSVDKNNDLWVGGQDNNAFDRLDGFTGEAEYTFDVGTGGYGGLVDCNDVLWSVSRSGNTGLFWYDTNQDIADTECCRADILTDSNNDGVIDEEDELVEDQEAITFPVNSDDDNQNDQSDFDDDGPVYGEDDLQEIQLHVSCYIDHPNAWWSLSWVDPDPDGDPDTPTIRIWRYPDKSDGGPDNPGPGVPLLNALDCEGCPDAGRYFEWPVPSSVWIEASDTFDEIVITFTITYDASRTQKNDTVKANPKCTPPTVAKHRSNRPA